jgi:hypothetical protein
MGILFWKGVGEQLNVSATTGAHFKVKLTASGARKDSAPLESLQSGSVLCSQPWYRVTV